MGYLNLIDFDKVYADTSVFIYTIESHPEYWSLLQPLWLKFQSSLINIYTSELTLLEVLINPMKEKDNLLISDYEKLLLDTNIQLKPITQSILREAANLRANTTIILKEVIEQ